MEDKYRLQLIGITYNQIESGVYAVILQQEGTSTRIPIIIGATEAQSIECKLQEVVTPRPLTHDMMASLISSFGISLREVMIRKLENGVFAADLILSDGNRTVTVDSRSSDAIALAIRVGAPIYTTADVLRDAGFEAPQKSSQKNPSPFTTTPLPSDRLSQSTSEIEMSHKSIEDLEREMEQAAEDEDYEKASLIKAEIEKRIKNR